MNDHFMLSITDPQEPRHRLWTETEISTEHEMDARLSMLQSLHSGHTLEVGSPSEYPILREVPMAKSLAGYKPRQANRQETAPPLLRAPDVVSAESCH